jgi:hypothetical protein
MTTEEVINKTKKRRKELEVELGERMAYLDTQRQYAPLSEACASVCKMLEGQIKSVEGKIKLCDSVIDYGEKLLSNIIKIREESTIDEYDQWLGLQGIN